MPCIEIDENAREVIRGWKKLFAKEGKKLDYSECIRAMNELGKHLDVDIRVSKEQEFKNAVKPIVENMMKTKVAKKK
jgi:hypothetical protein